MSVIRTIALAAGLAVCQAGASFAGDNPVEERLIALLQSQGFHVIEDGYTWLGRLRIVADSSTEHREIVVNPATGEVLRDYAELLPSGSGGRTVAVASTGVGSGIGASATGAVVADGVELPPTPQN